MSANPNKNRTFQLLVESLFRTGSMVQAIHDAGISPGRAAQILRSRRTRRLLETYRFLDATHKDFTLSRVSITALTALIDQLNAEGNPALKLRSAQSLLQFTTPKPRPTEPEPNPDEAELDPAEDRTSDYWRFNPRPTPSA